MSRRILLVLPLCALAGAAAGCGGAGGGGAVQAWRAEPPSFAPPDPSRFAAQQRRRPVSVRVRSAPAPARARAVASAPAAGAPSDAEIRAELRAAYGGSAGDDLNRAAIGGDGLAIIPATAPHRLVAIMHAANQVARKPYVYGGGHGRNAGEIWQDSAYDCSGSVSFALAAAGLLDGPQDSTALMSFGRPGPGRWVSIYANAGHAFMVVAGLRFDTSGRQVTGTRWQSADARSYAGFTVRHPPGL